MEPLKIKLNKCIPVLRIVFSLIWLTLLSDTDSYFSIYALIAFLSFYLQLKNFGSVSHRPTGMVLSFVLSFLFSAGIILANYPVFTTIGDPAIIGKSTSIIMNLINFCLALVGGICVFFPVFSWLYSFYPRSKSAAVSSEPRRWVPYVIFGSIVLINALHLFLVEYPGNLTEDTFTQISEMVSGTYSNFNTYWHTMIFQWVLTAGYGLFHDVNTAAALFTFLQMMILSAAFTFCLMTLIRMGIPRPVVFVSFFIYCFIPYNLALSITVWKDVLFSAATLFVLCSWLRIQKGIGSKGFRNYVVFILGSLLFLLSRTNGWMIYLVTFFVVLLFSRKDRRFLAAMGSMALLGWFLLNPALSLLGVSGGDPVESFSIPIQQVSRVIAEGCEISEEDQQLLSRIVDIEEVPDLYTNWISDPMKVEVRSKDYAFFLDHLSEYGRLWLRLGIRYPWEYVKAWVDQTKGYWNGGYDYFLYAETITDNPYGIEKKAGGNPVASLFRLYFGLSRHLIFFEPLHSIGLHIWIVILCFILNLKNRREQWLLSVPLLVLVAGLWLGTPVYACFRYAYPIFVSFPLIVSTALWSSAEA